jgi:hypothetical protein
MPSFDDLRPYLAAISDLSGPSYVVISGPELLAALRESGEVPEAEFMGRLRVLKQGGMIDYNKRPPLGNAASYYRVQLTTQGRQQVERWPTSASMSAADFQALLAAFAERAEDETLPDDERGKIRAAMETLRALGTGVGVSVLSAWATQQTGLS